MRPKRLKNRLQVRQHSAAASRLSVPHDMVIFQFSTDNVALLKPFWSRAKFVIFLMSLVFIGIFRKSWEGRLGLGCFLLLKNPFPGRELVRFGIRLLADEICLIKLVKTMTKFPSLVFSSLWSIIHFWLLASILVTLYAYLIAVECDTQSQIDWEQQAQLVFRGVSGHNGPGTSKQKSRWPFLLQFLRVNFSPLKVDIDNGLVLQIGSVQVPEVGS